MLNEKRGKHRQPVAGAIWRILTSPVSIICLLCIGAAGCLLGAIVAQMPATVRASGAISSWLNSIPAPWNGAMAGWQAAGMTSLATSPLLSLFLAILNAMCALQTLVAFVPAWRYPEHLIPLEFKAPTAAAGWDMVTQAAASVGLSLHPQETEDATSGLWRYRTASNSGQRRWFWLALLGGITLLSAALLGSGNPENFHVYTVSPGETIVVPGTSDTSLTLDSIAPGTRPASYWQTSSARQELAQGRPRTYGRQTLFMLGKGPALRLSIADSAGQELAIMAYPPDSSPVSALSLHFTTEQEQTIALPPKNMRLRLANYASLPSQGIAGRAIALQIVRADTGDLLFQTVVTGQSLVIFQDMILTLVPEEYAVIRVQPVYWNWLAFSGLVFIAVGITGLFCIPQRQVWFGIGQSGEHVQGTVWYRKQDRASVWFRHLAIAMQRSDDAG